MESFIDSQHAGEVLSMASYKDVDDGGVLSMGSLVQMWGEEESCIIGCFKDSQDCGIIQKEITRV